MKTNFKLLIMSMSTLIALSSCGGGTANTKLSYDSEMIHYIGRHVTKTIGEQNMMLFANSCSGFEIGVDIKNETNNLYLTFYGTQTQPYACQFFNIYIDDELISKQSISNETKEFKIFENLAVGKHVVRINKLNEAQFSKMGLVSIRNEGLEFYKVESDKKIIEFYGDSITAGFGNLNPDMKEDELLASTDGMQSYGQICADDLGYESSIIGYSGIGLAMSENNKDKFLLDVYDTVDGETKWEAGNQKVDVAVINIGTNDTVSFSMMNETEKAEAREDFLSKYKTLVLDLKEKNPMVKVIAVADMMIPIHNTLKTAIDSVIAYVNDNYEEFAYYKEFTPNTGGGVGHPSLEAHEQFGHELAEFIKTL